VPLTRSVLTAPTARASGSTSSIRSAIEILYGIVMLAPLSEMARANSTKSLVLPPVQEPT